ncbi:MAG: D-glycero-beta-D-manno-heptose-7-phosphate kinase [Ignavibacteriae bacterium]|nr:MAG: D-glycero-beta-D-manno-heptose-7-phosphate kinase [Ignavibacteriota bacterium]
MDIEFSPQKLNKIFNKVKDKRIAIIGDVMLDKYVYGEVSRISPEAPVQVVDINNVEYKLGGAANVANNVKTLEAEPILIGLVGNDFDGDVFIETMKEHRLSTVGIFKDKARPTTSKTRVIAHSQHIIRIDSEIKQDADEKVSVKILNFLKRHLKSFEAVILQDYNKGILSTEMICKVIAMCKQAKIPVYVDPKFDNFFEYKDVTIFKPNRKEIQDAMGIRIHDEEDAEAAGVQLIEKINCEWLVLTRGEKGMMLFDKDKDNIIIHNIPTKAIKVADVSGAGDTVISTLAVALCGGANIKEAIILANHAAGLVCEEVGIVPIFKKNLIESFNSKG